MITTSKSILKNKNVDIIKIVVLFNLPGILDIYSLENLHKYMLFH